jgi:DNA-binding XRE family transcriptional regulator
MDVKALRRSLDMTQDQLAEIVPTTKRTIIRWEQRHVMPNPIAVARLKAIQTAHDKTQPPSTPLTRRQLTAETDADTRELLSGIIPSSQ